MRHAESDIIILIIVILIDHKKKSGLKMTQICAEYLKKIILDMIFFFVLLH